MGDLDVLSTIAVLVSSTRPILHAGPLDLYVALPARFHLEVNTAKPLILSSKYPCATVVDGPPITQHTHLWHLQCHDFDVVKPLSLHPAPSPRPFRRSSRSPSLTRTLPFSSGSGSLQMRERDSEFPTVLSFLSCQFGTRANKLRSLLSHLPPTQPQPTRYYDTQKAATPASSAPPGPTASVK